jgi:CheY-like chemotaxis protein
MTSAGVKLLVVDDDETIRSSFLLIFQSLGYQARSASDGFSALSEMRAQIPDILLSDLNMPGMSGFELLSIVRRRFPSIYVIAMSGSFSAQGMEPDLPADNFHEKATSLPRLLEIVESAAQTVATERLKRDGVLTPVWIAKNGHDVSGQPFITITCPDCLRTFPTMLTNSGSHVNEARCTYCATGVRYAVVPQSKPALSVAY